MFDVNEATMREQVDCVWGGSHRPSSPSSKPRFQPEGWHIIQVEGQDIGVLIVEEGDQEIYLAEIQILFDWQGRGIGTFDRRSLMEKAAV